MTLKLNGSSSGYTAINAPASAGSNTLVLPTSNGSANQILQTDGSGNLSWVDKPSSGVTEVDQWQITADFTGGSDPITSGWARNTQNYEKIGTGLSESSGVFSFPSTGKWWIAFQLLTITGVSDGTYHGLYYYVTVNNGTAWTQRGRCYSSNGNGYGTGSSTHFLDVTNTSNVKIRFSVNTSNGSNGTTLGSTTAHLTGFTAIRLGDT